jgi:hypothetical protein
MTASFLTSTRKNNKTANAFNPVSTEDRI